MFPNGYCVRAGSSSLAELAVRGWELGSWLDVPVRLYRDEDWKCWSDHSNGGRSLVGLESIGV